MTAPQHRNRLTLAVYTSDLQGLYDGELVNQIRHLAQLKGYQVILIQTGGFGRYDSELFLDRYDAALIVRNAISPKLAERLHDRKIPAAAIAYDYFPVPIPTVAMDNEGGVKMAFKELTAKGCRKIAFVGDLSLYDLRKRYEAYCAEFDNRGWALEESHLFTVNDAQFAGGRAAAREFLQRSCDADAVIIGSGLTAVAFVEHLRDQDPQCAASLQCVCFDAFPLIPLMAPTLSCIDQNLNVMAYRALNNVESQMAGEPPQQLTLVEPKIIAASDPDYQSAAILSNCIDSAELSNPHYIKTISANSYNWSRDIACSNLENIMSLSILFKRFMAVAFLVRHVDRHNGEQWSRHIESFFLDTNEIQDSGNDAGYTPCASFPPATISAVLQEDHDLCTVLPIQLRDSIWGYLCVYGSEKSRCGSYFGFAGYLGSIVEMYQSRLAITHDEDLEAKQKDPRTIKIDPLAIVNWDLSTGDTLWSVTALSKLGFSSQIEQQIYQHMELTDRIHNQDIESLRQAIKLCRYDLIPIDLTLRIKPKRGDFVPARLCGETVLNSDNFPIIMRFSLGVWSPSA